MGTSSNDKIYSFYNPMIRQVTSLENTDKIKYFLEKVVNDGTGQNAKIDHFDM